MPTEPSVIEQGVCWLAAGSRACNAYRQARYASDLAEIARGEILAEEQIAALDAQRRHADEVMKSSSQTALRTLAYLTPVIALVGGGIALAMWWSNSRRREGGYSSISTKELRDMTRQSNPDVDDMLVVDTLADVIGDPPLRTPRTVNERAVLAQHPKFKKAMRELTGRVDPTDIEIRDALIDEGIDYNTASSYAFYAADNFGD